MYLNSIFSKKLSGVLVHPTCIPGGSYCGTFGEGLKNWIKLLSKNDICLWQFLPLTPTDNNGSPYNSYSTFALNHWFLDVDELIKENYINEFDLNKFLGPKNDNSDAFDFKTADKLSKEIGKLLLNSWERQSQEKKYLFKKWLDNNNWVNDYSIYMVLKEEFQMKPWWNWPKDFSNNNREVIKIFLKNRSERLLIQQLIQWHLNRQWLNIKKFSKSKGVKLIGDLPFYVAKDSVDVWLNKSLFSIKEDGELLFQSGVPPDYFSSTGQLWGTPVYSWSQHKLTNFDWWIRRFKRQFELVDFLRVDHFRALSGYWRVKGNAKNAIDGEWIDSPGDALFNSLKKNLGINYLPIIAEDLGVITKDVNQLRENFGLPGMKILQFAFDGNDENPYLPKNIIGDNWVIYTGTHDNSTSISWWNNLDKKVKENLREVYGFSRNPSWDLIIMGIKSDAKFFISPIQDILSMDDLSRLNKPGTIEGNWKWKLNKSLNDIEIYIKKFGDISKKYDRNINL